MIRIVALLSFLLVAIAPASAQYSLNTETQTKVSSYGLTIRTPGSLNYSYANSPIPLPDWNARSFNLETHAEMTLTEEELGDLVSYRQALRDLPSNTTDPTNPEWPNYEP